MSNIPPKTMPPAHPFDTSYLNDFGDGDKLKEECGVFGVVGVVDAANFVALGLHALQQAESSPMTPRRDFNLPAALAMSATTSPAKK